MELGLAYSPVPHELQYAFYTDPITEHSEEEFVDQKLNQWSLPLRLQLQVQAFLQLNFGGGLRHRSLIKSSVSEYTAPASGAAFYELVKDNFKPLSAFWEVGLVYDRGPWSLDLRYQRFMGATFHTLGYNGRSYENKSREWAFTLAFGHRLQRYFPAKKHVDFSKFKSPVLSPSNRLVWGVGIATGLEQSFLYHNRLSITEYIYSGYTFNSPLKTNLFAYYSFNPRWRIQGELWFQKSSINYTVRSGPETIPFSAIIEVDGTIDVSRIEIPLNIHYSFPSKLRLFTGLGLEVNRHQQGQDIPTDVNADAAFIAAYNQVNQFYKNTSIVWDGGIGYDWGQFAFNIRYRSTLGQKRVEKNFHRKQILFGLQYCINKR